MIFSMDGLQITGYPIWSDIETEDIKRDDVIKTYRIAKILYYVLVLFIFYIQLYYQL